MKYRAHDRPFFTADAEMSAYFKFRLSCCVTKLDRIWIIFTFTFILIFTFIFHFDVHFDVHIHAMFMQYGQAALTYITDVQHGHGFATWVWTRSINMDMQH
jgi:hypothetical protein